MAGDEALQFAGFWGGVLWRNFVVGARRGGGVLSGWRRGFATFWEGCCQQDDAPVAGDNGTVAWMLGGKKNEPNSSEGTGRFVWFTRSDSDSITFRSNSSDQIRTVTGRSGSVFKNHGVDIAQIMINNLETLDNFYSINTSHPSQV